MLKKQREEPSASVPDDANTFDMLAVKAYDKQQLIGYVSALEGEDVRALIIARKERNLRTRCIGCNSKNEGDKAGLQLMVRALSDVSDEEMEQARREIYDDKIYDDWQYSGPVLPIEQLTRFSELHHDARRRHQQHHPPQEYAL